MPSDPSTKDLIAAARKEAGRLLYWQFTARSLLTDLADRLEEVEEERRTWRREAAKAAADRILAPEPSDPEPSPGVEVTRTTIADGDTYNPQWMPPEDPEPEDDPWEGIERLEGLPDMEWAEAVTIAALLDLRERVEEMKFRTDTLSSESNRLSDRLTTLEGHADRGAEAERELRAMVDSCVSTLYRVAPLVERVETLEAERKVSLEARRHLLDEVEKLWRMEERVADIEAVLPVPASAEDSP